MEVEQQLLRLIAHASVEACCGGEACSGSASTTSTSTGTGTGTSTGDSAGGTSSGAGGGAGVAEGNGWHILAIEAFELVASPKRRYSAQALRRTYTHTFIIEV